MAELHNRLTFWLLGCCAILLLIIAMELSFPVAVSTAAGTTAVEPMLPELPESERYVAPPMAAYAATLEKPIFFQARRMPEAPVAPAAPPTPLRLRLEGVVVSGHTRIAVLRNLADNQLVQLAPGRDHDGWRLIEVGADRATFDRNGQTTVLALEIGDRRRR